MAKARKRKTKFRKKTATGKKSTSKKKSASKKKAVRTKSTRTAEAAPPRAAQPKPQADDIDAKRAAVIECVKGAMGTNFPGWNDDGRGLSRAMDTDFQANVNSMQALLDVVRDCLLKKGGGFRGANTPAASTAPHRISVEGDDGAGQSSLESRRTDPTSLADLVLLRHLASRPISASGLSRLLSSVDSS